MRAQFETMKKDLAEIRDQLRQKYYADYLIKHPHDQTRYPTIERFNSDYMERIINDHKANIHYGSWKTLDARTGGKMGPKVDVEKFHKAAEKSNDTNHTANYIFYCYSILNAIDYLTDPKRKNISESRFNFIKEHVTYLKEHVGLKPKQKIAVASLENEITNLHDDLLAKYYREQIAKYPHLQNKYQTLEQFKLWFHSDYLVPRKANVHHSHWVADVINVQGGQIGAKIDVLKYQKEAQKSDESNHTEKYLFYCLSILNALETLNEKSQNRPENIPDDRLEFVAEHIKYAKEHVVEKPKLAVKQEEAPSILKPLARSPELNLLLDSDEFKAIKAYRDFLQNDKQRSHTFFGINLAVPEKYETLKNFINGMKQANTVPELKAKLIEFYKYKGVEGGPYDILNRGQNAWTRFWNWAMTTTTIDKIDAFNEKVNAPSSEKTPLLG